jgi:hypothetical protein
MESKLRVLCLGLLDKPVNLMHEQHDSIEMLKNVGRKNQRRLNEVEFVVHKFTRAMTNVDECLQNTEQLQKDLQQSRKWLEE